MKWQHKCDLGWLTERQSCLTATDVKELLPITKTGKPRKIDSSDYLKVMARKLVKLTEEDCYSYGAAARGHILEPYAIDAFNSFTALSSGEMLRPLYHWDVTVVKKDPTVEFGLAFSPDATNVEESQYADTLFNTIGEVKSYGAERHLECGVTDRMKLEERWQIATAMAVRPQIKTAYLLFFNPSMPQQMFTKQYSRTDLADEIEMVNDVEKAWLSFIDNEFTNMMQSSFYFLGDRDDEQKIIKQIKMKELYSPFKSVVD